MSSVISHHHWSSSLSLQSSSSSSTLSLIWWFSPGRDAHSGIACELVYGVTCPSVTVRLVAAVTAVSLTVALPTDLHMRKPIDLQVSVKRLNEGWKLSFINWSFIQLGLIFLLLHVNQVASYLNAVRVITLELLLTAGDVANRLVAAVGTIRVPVARPVLGDAVALVPTLELSGSTSCCVAQFVPFVQTVHLWYRTKIQNQPKGKKIFTFPSSPGQSTSPSHCQARGMQRPVLQRNSSVWQVEISPEKYAGWNPSWKKSVEISLEKIDWNHSWKNKVKSLLQKKVEISPEKISRLKSLLEKIGWDLSWKKLIEITPEKIRWNCS